MEDGMEDAMMEMWDSFVIVKSCEYPSKEIHEADDDPCQAKESDGRGDPHPAAAAPSSPARTHRQGYRACALPAGHPPSGKLYAI